MFDQLRNDRSELVERAAGHTRGCDRLFRDARRCREDRREVGLRNVLRVFFRRLLDVDAAHVAEDQDRQLAPTIPGDAGVVLLCDRALFLHENGARFLATNHDDRQDFFVDPSRFIRRVRELDGAGFHAIPGEDLALEHDRATDPMRDVSGVIGGAGDVAIAQRQAVASKKRF